jgi:hypothetical protein
LSKDLNKSLIPLGLERQRPLALVPVDNREHHAALEHLRLEIPGMFFPFGCVANLETWFIARASAASSATKTPLIASYIMVRLSLVNAAQFIKVTFEIAIEKNSSRQFQI